MCGIVGYIGKNNCIPILIEGLHRLEYRGYDSAGIAYFTNKEFKIIKSVGRINNLEKKINPNEKSFIGIGHTRWATHGEANTINSHPHKVGNVTIVHNGILENYNELKKELISEGYQFKSDTDTEVLCAYIDYEYNNNRGKNNNKDILKILTNCTKVFQGSYAVAICFENINDKIYVLKKDSPLIIGIGDNENYIASDISAFTGIANSYIPLEDMEIGVITAKNISIYKNMTEIKYGLKSIFQDYNYNDKMGYEHYMLKEINEQTDMINKLNELYLDKLENIIDISKYNKINIVACGTAYHAGLIGKHLLEMYGDYEIGVYVASEYRYQKLFIDQNTLVIVVSQSGETADTLACLKRVKEYKCHTLGIINVKDSSIARYVDEVIYTEAGQEVAVASTKAYVSQIYIFSLIAFKLGIKKKIIDIKKTLTNYKKLPLLIKDMLNYDYNDIIEKFWNANDIFFLGRNVDYYSVMEGSLKLKEISYVHSEAYQAGELKHGTISLIEQNTGVIALISNEKTASKTISNIKEVKARGAYVVLLIKKSLNKNIENTCYDKLIIIDDSCELLQALVNIIPLQLIAYYVAKRRGCDIDKPRNLAKSVTVE